MLTRDRPAAMQRPYVPTLTCQESSELCEKDNADEVFQRLGWCAVKITDKHIDV